MRFLALRATPGQWALAFSILASTLVALASLFEGTLVEPKLLRSGEGTFIQHPYIGNTSTILDFALFDPLAIYFGLNARSEIARSYKHFGVSGGLPRFHSLGLVPVSLIVGITTMWFYYQGFVGSTIFTEAFEMGATGRAEISLTGWLIFVATSIFLSILFYIAIEFGAYVLFIGRTKADNYRFRLPPSISEDIIIAVRPCVCATYVLVVLFFILSIFILRDFWQLGLSESRRVWLLIPYLGACLIAFLPFWHLHRIMDTQKANVIHANNSIIEREMSEVEGDSSPVSSERLMQSVERWEKLQSFYKSIKVWPSSSRTLLIPNLSVVISVVTLSLKLIDSLKLR